MGSSAFVVREHPARTLSWWYQRRQQIDLSPLFQRRGDLWPPTDRAFLIDSILNGFDIPKLYMADFNYGKSALQSAGALYAVIDGRQRLDAVFGFFEDKFPLNKDFVYENDPSFGLAGKTYSEVRRDYPSIASIFEEFNLSVMSVWTEDTSKINQLFIRLNRSKPLTGPELRNAVDSKVSEETRKIVNHRFFAKNTSFQTKRGADKNLATKLLLIEFNAGFVNTKKVDLDRFAKTTLSLADAEVTALHEASKKVAVVLSRMATEFNERDSLLKSAGLIPVYYWLFRENGSDGLRDFIDFWNDITRLEFETQQLLRSEFDNLLLRRVAQFNQSKRNVNDAFSLKPLYGVMASELRRYRLHEHDTLVSRIRTILEKR